MGVCGLRLAVRVGQRSSMPDELVGEPYGLSGDTQKALTARGHKFAEKPRYLGDAEGIMIEEKSGVRLGATDPRRSDGQAVGY